jgi:hypothetical protein
LLSGIHTGVCGGHIGARALATNVLRQGFCRPTIIDDTAKLVATCEDCQKFSHRLRAPTQPSQLITPSWPLQRWVIDIVGNLTPAQGNYTFTIIVVEYFTKWIDAKSITNISSATIKKFFWQNIICRYGVPREITIDNIKQFSNDMFKNFCNQIETKVAFALVYHLQSNGAIERTNTSIFEAIKKILEYKKKGRVEVMPKVIWSHNTIVLRATNFTPFLLLFGAEIVGVVIHVHLRNSN